MANLTHLCPLKQQDDIRPCRQCIHLLKYLSKSFVLVFLVLSNSFTFLFLKNFIGFLLNIAQCLKQLHIGVHGGAVVTHSPPTSEVCCSIPRPYVGKMVVAYRWPTVYSTEPLHSTVCTGFLCPQNCPL